MGYLIQGGLQKVTVRIPQADVLTLDTVPYTIIPFTNNNNYTILAANMQVDNIVGNQVDSFDTFYLFYKPSPTPPIAIYDTIASGTVGINTQATYNFILNLSNPPNIFGSVAPNVIFPLTIKSRLQPNANCDLIVTVYYFNNF